MLTLWLLRIDAICINQEDVNERSQEVRRMSQIYSRATRVIIWLGPESDNSSLAIRTLLSFEKDLVDDYPSNMYTTDTSAPYREENSRAENVEDNPDMWDTEEDLKGSLPAIQLLFQRPWFTRLWVYQECQLATDGIVVAGFDTILLAKFVRASSWFIYGALQNRMPNSQEHEKIDRAFSLIQSRSNGSFLDLVIYSKHYICEDPRDRVYALIGLLPSPLDEYESVPDYKLPVDEVYKQFFLFFITQTTVLRFLGPPFVGDQGESARAIPSWIPDLSCRIHPLPLGAASHNAAADVTHSSTDNSLHAHGVRVTNIIKVCDPVSIGASHIDIVAKCVSWEPKDLFTGKYRDGRPLLEAFMDALLGGLIGEWTHHHDTAKESGSDYTKHTMDVQLNMALAATLRGRTFFSTSDGYFGICPSTTRPGDIVCVVLSAPLPLVLHPIHERPGCFQLRGECYVPGLMRGEALCGDLPLSEASGEPWTMRFKKLNDLPMFTDGKSYTQTDPRLPPLPQGWVMRFDFGPEDNDDALFQDDEYDSDGNMGEIWFINEAEGLEEENDPRMTPEALKARGVDIQNIILV